AWLECLAALRELAYSPDRHQLHSGFGEDFFRVGGMDASIASHQTRRTAKHLPMMLHRFYRLPMLVGLFQDPIAGHEAAFDLIQDHMPPKLDFGTPLV